MTKVLVNAFLSILIACLSAAVMSIGQFTRAQIVTIALGTSILSFLSTRVRCSLFLTIPSIITKTGRVVLAVYALELVITGPLNDFFVNLDLFLRMSICFIKLYLKYTIGELRETSLDTY